jgi:hypothetical protein
MCKFVRHFSTFRAPTLAMADFCRRCQEWIIDATVAALEHILIMAQLALVGNGAALAFPCFWRLRLHIGLDREAHRALQVVHRMERINVTVLAFAFP